jgi:HAD superfamily hydrolase (TIGR01549 family)
VPAFIFDLDGTLVDSVYQHIFAWHAALRRCGYDLPMWRIHRKIGMSGTLLMNAFALELNVSFDERAAKRLEELHAEEFARLRSTMRPFAGAQQLIGTLRRNDVQCAIATSGDKHDVQPLIDLLGIDDGVPVVYKEDAQNPKPDPELFLKAAQALGSASDETMVVGDSVWDMLAARRAHFLGIGLLTGGYAEAEMSAAGAFRVFRDPEQLCRHLYETGVNIKENA